MRIPDAVQTLDARSRRDLRRPAAVPRRLRRHARHDGRSHAHGAAHGAADAAHTLAIVDALTRERSARRARSRSPRWHDAGLATPLLLAAREFEQSLDAFPLEFGAILADHAVVVGRNPFDGADASTRPTCGARAKCRRAATCSTCAKGFLETRGRGDALAC